MNTTKTSYSPSINILRDADANFQYIPTSNAAAVVKSIFLNSTAGAKSHLVIGAYGTGKSSLLLAIKDSVTGKKNHFQSGKLQFNQNNRYECIPIVGDYTSLSRTFAELLGLDESYSSPEIFNSLRSRYNKAVKNGNGVIILIDEFGKYLEYAANNNPEVELYFIQQLAEWVNDPMLNTHLVATLHQDFNTYSFSLNNAQQQEWDKVKGRFHEIVFNEPVEQLLFLAAERIGQKFGGNNAIKGFDKLFKIIEESKAFPFKKLPDTTFAKKLYPLDLLSGAILTMALQKYGQNERSVFSFIESEDSLSMNDIGDKQVYNVANVYDYLINNFYSSITSRYNPHHAQWSTIRQTLEKCTSIFSDQDQDDASALIKAVGLLNLFVSAGAKLDAGFYEEYSRWALRIKDADKVLRMLELNNLIRFQKYNSRYVFVEGTDLDIELEIDNAGRLIERTKNFVDKLNEYFDFPYISAKASSYLTGTPRFFQFVLSDSPLVNSPEGEVDGFINLVFSKEADTEIKVAEVSRNCDEAILFGLYTNTLLVENTLFEIQKVSRVISENLDDKPAVKALSDILSHYVSLLNHYVLDGLYGGENVSWFYRGEKIDDIYDRHSFNQQLSFICDDVYPYTPVFKNELVNKTKVSSQISSARLRLIEKLLTQAEFENLGFSKNEFPPEKSIYLSLLRRTGIHDNRAGFWGWHEPVDSSFLSLWVSGNEYLESTKGKGRNLQEFIHILSKKPFKLKQGFIDFWVPVFLIVKSDEYALFDNGVYVPDLNIKILELISKKPDHFTIKAFDLVNLRLQLFNRYRQILSQQDTDKLSNKTFIQTIKPFLLFYKELPEYTKNTTRLKKPTLALRTAIASCKDPEKAFFEDFPTALGYTLVDLQNKKGEDQKYITHLQEAIKELKSSYINLAERLEKYLVEDVLGYSPKMDYRNLIRDRFRDIKIHLLLSSQKAFYDKLISPIDDKLAWLNSLTQVTLGKGLSYISDKEELVLHEKVKHLIYELDNLCEISREKVEENEDVLKVEITSFVNGLKSNLLRLTKKQSLEIEPKVKKLRSSLTKDRKLNIAVVAKLLQEILHDEEKG